jgi:hypothetical protein
MTRLTALGVQWITKTVDKPVRLNTPFLEGDSIQLFFLKKKAQPRSGRTSTAKP